MDLQFAIQKLVEEGGTDPHSIVAALHAEYGDEWMRVQGSLYVDDIALRMAQEELRYARRNGERAVVRDGDSDGELLESRAWIPSVGWKKVADLTPMDLRLRGDWYEKFAEAATTRAVWCREVADLMEKQKVLVLGDLKCAIPQIPGLLSERPRIPVAV